MSESPPKTDPVRLCVNEIHCISFLSLSLQHGRSTRYQVVSKDADSGSELDEGPADDEPKPKEKHGKRKRGEKGKVDDLKKEIKMVYHSLITLLELKIWTIAMLHILV